MILFFNFIKKYYSFIFFVIIVVLGVLLFQTNDSLKRERYLREYQEKQNAQNLSALKDSITVEFNKKLNAWEFSKDNYIVRKLSELEKYNKDLAEELKKVKGDVIAAVKTEVQGDLGGIETSNDLAVLNDKLNYYGITFKSDYKDSGFEQKLSGISKFYVIPNEQTKSWIIKPETTVIDTNFTSIKITYGFKELNDKYRVFAISESPKIELTDLTGGYFIDKQPIIPQIKKKWGFGPYLGYGLSTNSNAGEPRFGWNIGFAVHYDILQWKF